MIAVDKWQPVDGLTLEPNALRAAKEQTYCIAITAGPGAGKTEMLAQRADFLLRTGTCRYPKRILAISFKVDASTNLKERVQRRCGLELASRFDSYTFHAFAKRIIDRFRPVLKGNDALDVGYKIGKKRIPKEQIALSDLVPLAVKILKNSEIARNAVRQTYNDVFLDEFQDCTVRQYELVKIAFQDADIRVTAVGDTKQKIMGWAGALSGIFKTYASDFTAISLNMYRNFRSKPRLLRLQNEIIRVLDPASVMPDEQVEGEEGEIFIKHFTNSYEEAKCVANLVSEWIDGEQLAPSEIAILVSKQIGLYAEHLMNELQAKGIPYRNEQQMQDITVEPIARLIVDYLMCLYGEREPMAWVRLTNQLLPFADDEIHATERQNLNRLIKKQREDAAFAEQPFSGWWASTKTFLNQVSIETLVALSPDYESKDRLREILREVKVRIEELLDLEPHLPTVLERFSDDQSVRILTIHKSKGLEFDSVILLAVENEIFFGDLDENRCAFFVGVSRAKRRLLLTYADQRETPAGYTKRWDVNRSVQSEFVGYASGVLLDLSYASRPVFERHRGARLSG